MGITAIFGATGAIGRSLAAELDRREVPFRAVARNAARLRELFGGLPRAELLAADLSGPASARHAARGVENIVYTVGVPFAQFELHPRLMRIALDAAAESGARRMIVVSSVYSYGKPLTDRVAETHPREPVAYKGRMRRDQENAAIAAHGTHGMRALVLRLPDFYGPAAEQSLAHQVFDAALRDQPANWLGPVEAMHEFVYVPDTAPVIADLLGRDDCYGRAWNLGGPGPIATREFIEAVYRAAGNKPRWRTAGPLLMRAMGLVNPLIKELTELAYLQTEPVILDDSALLAKLGRIAKMSYEDGIGHTVEWMRGRARRKSPAAI